MSVNQEIFKFSKSSALWIQDLIRRVAQQPSLKKTDIEEVLTNLKASEGLCGKGACLPLDANHLSGRSAIPHLPTVLVSISDVSNANQLAPKQKMPFALKGLTIIYGYNGSGKSGYGRILRQLCRSRHENKQTIIGNVYGTKLSGPATATVAYRVGDTDYSVQWKDGTPSPDELAYISVFDATTAPLYADKQNKIEFLPMGLDILPALGEAFRTLSGMLDVEVIALTSKINVPLPTLRSQKYKALFSQLSPMGILKGYPSLQEVEKHCSWDETNEAKLLSVEGEIKKISEPAQILARNNRLIQAINTMHPRLEKIAKQLDTESIQRAFARMGAAKEAREAATITSRGQFNNDPIPNAPLTQAWRLLYAQAEAFNAELYPGSSFPETGTDRVCLLCQQQYNELASERMRRFKEFLENASQQEANTRERELSEYVQTVKAISMPTDQDIELPLAQLSEIMKEGSVLIQKAKTTNASLSSVKSSLLECLFGRTEVFSLSEADTSVLADLNAAKLSLEVENSSLNQQIQDSSILTKLNEEHSQLLDQKDCHGNLTIFQQRLSDLKTADALKRCKDQCGTDSVSRKNTQLREAHLTAEFEKRIKEEVSFIGLDYLPITVQSKTERGVGYMGVSLNKNGRNPSSDILSEGEFRGLALACFFAEIASIPSKDGIVVDDPVTSLDHLHTTRIAERLVKEAQNRPQVIVFTHDMGFYYELWSAAAEANVPLHRNWIYSEPQSIFGIVTSGDAPWQVKGVKERMVALEAMLAGYKGQTSRPPAQILKDTEAFYTKLRESWERAVEECLFNKVVGRFQTEVKTLALRGVSVTDDDHKTVFFAMKKSSEYSGHDRPAGRQPILRTVDEMRIDLEDLRKFFKETKERTEEVDKRRKALENPVKAEIA